ncbi:hypothetical protein AMS68_004858 [Peltaster fructicola]|uniref:Uncharacterized protein n=1 Tax=Peltaster fructicola TaxID=286661 RepID=A0A6H0XXF7_9PEZI|nr:hypothetical protein AMS68_004858 [Peltaster fructicola]
MATGRTSDLEVDAEKAMRKLLAKLKAYGLQYPASLKQVWHEERQKPVEPQDQEPRPCDRSSRELAGCARGLFDKHTHWDELLEQVSSSIGFDIIISHFDHAGVVLERDIFARQLVALALAQADSRNRPNNADSKKTLAAKGQTQRPGKRLAKLIKKEGSEDPGRYLSPVGPVERYETKPDVTLDHEPVLGHLNELNMIPNHHEEKSSQRLAQTMKEERSISADLVPYAAQRKADTDGFFTTAWLAKLDQFAPLTSEVSESASPLSLSIFDYIVFTVLPRQPTLE